MMLMKQAWLADDASGAGKAESLHAWYSGIKTQGSGTEYVFNDSKFWLIVKKISKSQIEQGRFSEVLLTLQLMDKGILVL